MSAAALPGQLKCVERRVIAAGVEVDMIVLYLHKCWQLENKVFHAEIRRTDTL